MHCTEACEHAPRAMLRKKACGNTVQDDFVTKMFLSHLRAHYKNENKILLSPMVFE
jgi:NADH:ubiquinone oxidoreductase subunit E